MNLLSTLKAMQNAQTQPLVFEGGKATIKDGRKVAAQIFDRVVFLKEQGVPGEYDTKDFPYAVTTKRGGWVTCRTLAEALDLVKEITGITVTHEQTK